MEHGLLDQIGLHEKLMESKEFSLQHPQQVHFLVLISALWSWRELAEKNMGILCVIFATLLCI
jgi:hypothetical protein